MTTQQIIGWTLLSSPAWWFIGFSFWLLGLRDALLFWSIAVFLIACLVIGSILIVTA